ncbi:unnamed protein product (macronuclear) [Paramecium tetraurelia]|uniref:Uncharacterized protein n=1 Tax=Paramecium tetraurelia TaxID=5888 RepID=A0DS71_PARTE|nr:uncharacterized protein GSPATT00019592001 [Paramecium tetraurelia]CAK85888.1 unnamed protein product [Paramecium tetraurelia]|eukprot:XP_001453285.1 hypothetical protein (macronuclear) [Paramecium tetraurelia strain d4-2]
MLSQKEYQRFTQTQLSEDQQNLDTSAYFESPLCSNNRQKRFTFTIENSVLKSQIDNQPKSQSQNKYSLPTHGNIQLPLKKSYILQGALSNRILRMKQKNKLQKSQSQIQAMQFPKFNNKIRRRSGCELLSDKQVRLATLYPITYIAFHQQQKETKRNEMRKKTIFKRMSSILIKHSNNLKSQSNLGISQQKIMDEIHTKLDEKSSHIILNQFQKQIGCLKESQDLLENMENSEKLLLLQEELKRYSQSLNNSPIIKRNSKKQSNERFFDSQKVVLDISKKQRKTFTSVQNYISERSQSNQTKSVGVIQKQIHFKYQNLQSLTETDTSSPVKIKTTQTARHFTHIKSLSNLPDIKEVQTQRINSNRIQKIAEKVKNVYIFSPSKNKQFLDKIKM